MTQVAFDPFSTEEIPSKGYINHLLWEHDLVGISPETNEVISYFLDQVCEESINGIDLVSAWISAVRDTYGGKHPQLQFPTTKTGFCKSSKGFGLERGWKKRDLAPEYQE